MLRSTVCIANSDTAVHTASRVYRIVYYELMSFTVFLSPYTQSVHYYVPALG